MRLSTLFLATLLLACQQSNPPPSAPEAAVQNPSAPARAEDLSARVNQYATVPLTADLSHLSANQRQMIAILIRAADIMDELFWQQTWGDKSALMQQIDDPAAREFAAINYGPWDRLAGDTPFIDGVGPKPPGARFYPEDMTREEFEAWEQAGKHGHYSMVRRDADGGLSLEPYHKVHADQIGAVARLLRQASALADDPEFADYLAMRADALEVDDYQPSDMAWMDMKNNPVDVVIGPIEFYEDGLFGFRAAYEGLVLIKDLEWSERLTRFAGYLPDLQAGLPVEEAYKREMPGANADLGAYDIVYYAGQANTGGKTIAINLPNDEEVQLAKGTRRLQLKNAMRAKFDQILEPIADSLIAEDQRQHVTFDAFFANTMFHEVAHGLGIKTVLDGSSTVRQALREHDAAMEEGKSDILGLYMIQQLRERGEITEGELMDNYVTFTASVFRSVRFGASSAHGRANMIRFNFFMDAGALIRDAGGRYRIDVPAFEDAVRNLSNRLLVLQGDGSYAAVDQFVNSLSSVGPTLQADLARVEAAGVPVDIVFEQGLEVLGLAD
jgi:hypothetical protein